ncbi:hypothetical protein NEUTE2DRAFT_74508, partial [Neurospora tetrasperma FGSC 2509]
DNRLKWNNAHSIHLRLRPGCTRLWRIQVGFSPTVTFCHKPGYEKSMMARKACGQSRGHLDSYDANMI